MPHQHCAMPVQEKKHLNQTDLDLALTWWDVKGGTYTAGSMLPGATTACLKEEASTDPLLNKVLQLYKAHILHLKSGCLT